MNLTTVQREVLMALVDLYHKSNGDAIKGEDIAELITKNPGTIRNQMQSLRSLGLVEGVPGPKGGYRPTAECYSVLNYAEAKDRVLVPIRKGYEILEGVTVTAIDLTTVFDPNRCNANVHAIGRLKDLTIGDEIIVGPTPINKFVLKGRVVGRDDIKNILLIDIQEMISVPKVKVENAASGVLKDITPNTKIRDVAKILHESGLRGAAVMDGDFTIGVVSNTDIMTSVAQGKEGGTVGEIMSKKVISINRNGFLYEAINIMENHDISRLVVVDNKGKTVGILTRRDILCRINSLFRSIPLGN